MPSKFYPVDISALRQLLSERATDWTVPFSTLIQAAVRVAYNHLQEWKHECDLITAHKHKGYVARAQIARERKAKK